MAMYRMIPYGPLDLFLRIMGGKTYPSAADKGRFAIFGEQAVNSGFDSYMMVVFLSVLVTVVLGVGIRSQADSSAPQECRQ